jgi:hypothetical protein
MKGLSLELRELWVEDQAYRVALFIDVVGNDWVIREEIGRLLSLDTVILGLSLPKLLAEWIEGSYKNWVLDIYKTDIIKGIDWLLTGDAEHLREVSKERLDSVEGMMIELERSYLEELLNY